ncbi:sodium:solute symporter family transporter [Caballeronia sp. LZ001]|uniref:solute symporter family protein n=1 Tax=Caballeronia sp. LZ001 TaxID=3038553 RepID=UPI0028558159|nr:cation acetate symporter [Caballeronia sp. LZ001]MDR5804779.1 cation acetate symporter [Caballeronia sp. LZ001]
MSSHHIVAVAFFLLFLAATVLITVWATKRSKSSKAFLIASGGISAWQNGFAMSGEYLSASALLGMTGLLATSGFGGYVYSISAAISWPMMLFLFAGPIRRLGKFTLADVLSHRLRQKPMRIATATSNIPITLFYLIGQLVAGGVLIKLLFGLPYAVSVIAVSLITLSYVLFGGMLATTWVQIIKAVLQCTGVALLTFLLLQHFGFNPGNVFRAVAETRGADYLGAPSLGGISRWDSISLSIGLLCGAMGLPQILTRFLTVPNVGAARKSALYSTVIVGLFHLMVLVLGFGALAMLGRETILHAGGGGNMAVPLLAEKLGGSSLFGFICGVSFATILAVVSGITLTSATTLAHDVWGSLSKSGTENTEPSVKVARASSVAVTAIAAILALAFENTNVAFLIGLSMAIAAATNFPILVLSLLWRRLTTNGAVWGMAVGAISSVVLIVVSPTVQVAVLHNNLAAMRAHWWFFPLSTPALITVPLAFAVSVTVSLMAREATSEAKFDALQLQDDTDMPSTPFVVKGH